MENNKTIEYWDERAKRKGANRLIGTYAYILQQGCSSGESFIDDVLNLIKEENNKIITIKINQEHFELQKLRDSWVRGNYNYTHEFIDWIDKRMKRLEEKNL